MPISAPGSNRATARRPVPPVGFTLIELLVVLAIVGISAAAVVMVMPDPRGSLRPTAERLAAQIHAARSNAILGARDMTLAISPTGYSFERRSGGRWLPIGERPFAPVAWPEGASVTPARARVRFDTTGGIEPIDLRIARSGAAIGLRIGLDGAIDVVP